MSLTVGPDSNPRWGAHLPLSFSLQISVLEDSLHGDEDELIRSNFRLPQSLNGRRVLASFPTTHPPAGRTLPPGRGLACCGGLPGLCAGLAAPLSSEGRLDCGAGRGCSPLVRLALDLFRVPCWVEAVQGRGGKGSAHTATCAHTLAGQIPMVLLPPTNLASLPSDLLLSVPGSSLQHLAGVLQAAPPWSWPCSDGLPPPPLPPTSCDLGKAPHPA